MTSKEAKDYLISLIERDTPKEVITLDSGLEGNEYINPPIYGCPVCKEVVVEYFVGCPKCLQRLEW